MPTGTYDQAEALKACQVWCAANGCFAACYDHAGCSGENLIVGQIASGSTTQMGWLESAGSVTNINLVTGMCAVVGTWD